MGALLNHHINLDHRSAMNKLRISRKKLMLEKKVCSYIYLPPEEKRCPLRHSIIGDENTFCCNAISMTV